MASQQQKTHLGWVSKNCLGTKVLVIMDALELVTECDYIEDIRNHVRLGVTPTIYLSGDLISEPCASLHSILALPPKVRCSSSCSPALLLAYIHHTKLYSSFISPSPTDPKSSLGAESYHLCVPVPSTRSGKEQRAGVWVGGKKEGRRNANFTLQCSSHLL